MAVEIVKVIKETINMSNDSVPVLIEEAPAEKWAEEVYKPDIIEKTFIIIKSPVTVIVNLHYRFTYIYI